MVMRKDLRVYGCIEVSFIKKLMGIFKSVTNFDTKYMNPLKKQWLSFMFMVFFLY